jgi:hypothetical protein
MYAMCCVLLAYCRVLRCPVAFAKKQYITPGDITAASSGGITNDESNADPGLAIAAHAVTFRYSKPAHPTCSSTATDGREARQHAIPNTVHHAQKMCTLHTMHRAHSRTSTGTLAMPILKFAGVITGQPVGVVTPVKENRTCEGVARYATPDAVV